MTAAMVREMFRDQQQEILRINEKQQIQENIQMEQVTNIAERMDTIMARIVELEWQWLPMQKGGKDGNLPEVMKEMKLQIRYLEEQLENLKGLGGQRWMDGGGSDHGGQGTYGGKEMWDTRRLKMDPYSGDKKTWRSFVFTLKAFIRRESPNLEKFMTEMEHRDEEIMHEDLLTIDLDLNEDKELVWMLTNFTKDEAKEQVQLCEGKPGLEIWRMLIKENDPKSGTSGVQAMQKLVGPSRCKTYLELKKGLIKWDTLMKAEVQRGGPASKIGQEVQATAIISMVPRTLEEEILKKGKKFVENYKEVRQFVEDMVYMHTIEGKETTVNNVEEDDEHEETEITDEHGNILIGTIMRKDGRKVFQARPWNKGGGKGNYYNGKR